MRRREFITLIGGAARSAGTTAFIVNLCFALLVAGLIAIDVVAAEAFLTHGRMSPLIEAIK